MTLTPGQVRRHVMDYLEATECSVLEQSDHHVTVKLSPHADRMLTDRPYYWGFVERTGAEPQTLSFTFVFDPAAYDALPAPRPAAPGTVRSYGTGAESIGGAGMANGHSGRAGMSKDGAGMTDSGADGAGTAMGRAGGAGVTSGNATSGSSAEFNPGTAAGQPGINAGAAGTHNAGTDANGISSTANGPGGANGAPQDTILGRYFGIVPELPRLGPNLIRREDVLYGSRRLKQIWQAARDEGRCLHLFEETSPRQRDTLFSASYEPWLAVCHRVEMSCDLKCEALYFSGVSLNTGQIVTDFGKRLAKIKLTPRLPENVHVQPYSLSLDQGAAELERHLTDELAKGDFDWAEQARLRLKLELAIIDAYYEDMLKEPDEEKRKAYEEQHERRRQETIWQYEPHISVSAVTYGLFHLRRT